MAGLLKNIPADSIHIKTPAQQYFRPSALREALSLKQERPDALVVCGATDIALRVTKQHELLVEIIDLSGIEELKGLEETASSLSIGAGVSLNRAMPVLRKDFPALYEMLSVFGSQQIRNLATFGGNLGTASPIGDTIPVLMAYNAKVVLQNTRARREVALDDFITGYRTTVRKPDELITAVVMPKMLSGALVRSYKVSKRKDLDISTVSAGFKVDFENGMSVKDVKLAYGGMAERVKRATDAENLLIGKKWDRETVVKAMEMIEKEFTPISDARGSAEFRRIAAKNLLMKFWGETRNGGNE